MDKKWVLIGIILLAVSLFFVALSNRYMTKFDGRRDVIFDKWTGQEKPVYARPQSNPPLSDFLSMPSKKDKSPKWVNDLDDNKPSKLINDL